VFDRACIISRNLAIRLDAVDLITAAKLRAESPFLDIKKPKTDERRLASHPLPSREQPAKANAECR